MGEFEVSRSRHIAVPPREVHALIDDFRAWTRWSPWEGLGALGAAATNG